ncbi:hypothetical protein AKI39_21755 [Bordetella sp. H567]|uniref:MAE_28990/MAE_18760 family HEPN-like nuclease n=1 Tax=Bordetella sp. H567 TaxID=1697043 RepID=UPI00081C6CFC|nr:MAE_28990/MAE_18760 family HEPN-like nuclease [Bordetella sp. H567]AOB32799.1 hypothetical protein AKI39_21755 [Bordetella sp. H567]
MDAADFRAQLEAELAWRLDEIRFFQNQCSVIDNEESQNKFRRALILLLYSNFEGLCKFAFTLYVTAINAEGVTCKFASRAVAAAALSEMFHYLRDANGKLQNFKKMGMPDDKELHRYGREREFFENAAEIMEKVVVIPEKVVDAESNLNPQILRKILYRLGLPHDQFVALEDAIEQLLILRNRIAHGETKEGIRERTYERFRDSAFRIMNDIIISISTAFADRHYLLPVANNPA